MSQPPATSPWQPMPPVLTLAPNHIHLFLASTDLPTASITALESLLTTEERERLARIRIPAKRTEAVLSRALLRDRLSHFLKTPAPEIPLTVNPHGKPLLANSALHFNLSHTAGYILLAISPDHDLGIDIESPRDKLSHEDLAKRYFTPAEHAALIALPESDRMLAFFRCWTRKEALLKAVGRGISAGLDTFEVPLHPLCSPHTLTDWTLHDLPVPSPLLAALATHAPNPHLHFWLWQQQ